MNQTIVGLIIAIVIGFFVWFFEFRTTKDDKRYEELKQALDKNGISAVARVKKVVRMITSTAPVTHFAWILEVELPNGEKYEVSEDALHNKETFILDNTFVAYAQRKGAVIPVTVHPTKHDVLMIDRKRLLELVQE